MHAFDNNVEVCKLSCNRMLLSLRQRAGTFSSLLNFARVAHCILQCVMKRIEGNNPLICCSTALTMKNSGFRLDYLRVVGYVGQNRDGTPGIVTSRHQ